LIPAFRRITKTKLRNASNVKKVFVQIQNFW